MRTHGWGGQPPASDEDAIGRILEATRRCVAEQGAATSIADVARALRVTRQTIYRYFASTEALLWQVSLDAVAEFLDRQAAHLRGITEPVDAVVEALAFSAEQLPQEPYVGLALAAGRTRTLAVGVTSDVGLGLGRTSLTLWDVDWSAHGFDDRRLDELAEITNRTLQSLILDPGRPPRTGAELRRFIARWIGSAVRTLADVTLEGDR